MVNHLVDQANGNALTAPCRPKVATKWLTVAQGQGFRGWPDSAVGRVILTGSVYGLMTICCL